MMRLLNIFFVSAMGKSVYDGELITSPEWMKPLVVPEMQNLTELRENLREMFKIDYLEEQFAKFDAQAKQDLGKVAEILEPENVRQELVQYFAHIDEQMQQFSEDIKE